MVRKRLTIDPQQCTGCRVCELACSFKYTGEFNPIRARIHVIGYEEPFSLPVVCLQCEKPYCAEVCPSDAIVKDEVTSVVHVLSEKCTGCKMCVLACPFGNIAFDDEANTAVKCELCNGKPECVPLCTSGALKYQETDTVPASRREALRKRIKLIYEKMEAAPGYRQRALQEELKSTYEKIG